ncbi:MAG: hypothetical protein HFG45_07285 [Oscillospiraceae bacterium]|jgi:hypothetical protein|nr:hypothetical protein [Oscillospiraceae bacterium]
MQLKLKLSVLSVLTLCALLTSVAAIRSFALVKNQNAVQPPPVAQQYTDYAGAEYVLKEADGYVAVFSARGQALVEKTNIPVKNLRAADRALLEAGITAADRQALLELLEDIGS